MRLSTQPDHALHTFSGGRPVEDADAVSRGLRIRCSGRRLMDRGHRFVSPRCFGCPLVAMPPATAVAPGPPYCFSGVLAPRSPRSCPAPGSRVVRQGALRVDRLDRFPLSAVFTCVLLLPLCAPRPVAANSGRNSNKSASKSTVKSKKAVELIKRGNAI